MQGDQRHVGLRSSASASAGDWNPGPPPGPAEWPGMACEWLLVDGSSLIFRAYYGALASARKTGTRGNAIAGFADRLARLLVDRRPRRLVIAEDRAWRPEWRVDLIAGYKAHRVA